jgi:hypothetical protein
LGIIHMEDWYEISKFQIEKNGGRQLLRNYGDEMGRLLGNLYPEIDWHPWKFEDVSDSFWNESENCRNFFDWLGNKMGVKSPFDWYKVNRFDISNNGGRGILRAFKNNSKDALLNAYPNLEPFLRYHGVSQDFWNDPMERRKYFDWFAKHMGIFKQEDWYRITPEDIMGMGGEYILSYYSNNLSHALESIYGGMNGFAPLPWLFTRVPIGFWNDPKQQKRFMDWIAKKFQVNFPEDWCKVRKVDIENHGGRGLLLLYDNSILEILSSIYPEVGTIVRYCEADRDYWNRVENRMEYLQWIAESFGIKFLEDWYEITAERIRKMGGKQLMDIHSNSIHKLLQSTCFEVEWQPWRFVQTNFGRWGTMENQRKFLDWLGSKIGIQEPSQWYEVSGEEIIARGGIHLLNHYSKSPYKMLQAIYPEHEWQPWRFSRIPNGFWNDPSNGKNFFDWLALQLNVKQWEDWYGVTKSDIEGNGGGTLLQLHQDSPRNALIAAYPHLEGELRYFNPPEEFWDSIENRIEYFDWLAKRLRVEFPSDWYSVEIEKIIKLGGTYLLKEYDHSLGKALASLFGNFEWQQWKFAISKEEFRQHKKILEEMERNLHIMHPMDWYGVSTRHLMNQGEGSYLLGRYQGSLLNILRAHYPDQRWNQEKWNILAKSKSQQLLFRILSFLMSPSPLEYNANLPMLRYPNKHPMQIDVWMPLHNVAVEYQGEQHYKDNNLMAEDATVDLLYSRDRTKERACKDCDILFLKIPYWRNLDSKFLENALKGVCS